ncbi:DUF4350 domain-containing protein [Chitinophaga sp. Cy-1792]|uniref:DUF4350 domain-containing protein n=1 Tax=Chitinophaga sp. Cy-1792 TaxID=2608339 RepID=UPI0014228827|nr:DUF4350 domain-containing protein [Chitinophaga sp. Cy-1792]NIG57060.1 DUF4350 domain-containing protein [Chitinophaga sp. Cy-1792]
MSKKFYYIAGAVVGLLVILLVLTSSNNRDEAKHSTDMSHPSFSSKDKEAGGAYSAFQLLPSLFSNNPVQIVTKPFSVSYKKDEQLKRTGNAYIIVANQLFLSKQDVTDLLEYVQAGNELFIAANRIDQQLNDKLGIVTSLMEDGGVVMPGSQQYIDTLNDINKTYRYKGPVLERYFTKADTSLTRVLGYSPHDHPNFVRMRYGNGRIFILLNPYTFTNYFLLHNNNAEALSIQMSYMDEVAENLYWDDFYNTQLGPRNDDFSEWQVLLRYPAIRWALWLTLALMLLYVGFESKRRQRIIPIKPAVTNASLEFVDTIGQLYYQQHDHVNISHKMVVHVLEYIRSRYYLNTNTLDGDFAILLSKKTAVSEEEAKRLVRLINNVQQHGYIDAEFVRELYRSIQLFYLNTK